MAFETSIKIGADTRSAEASLARVDGGLRKVGRTAALTESKSVRSFDRMRLSLGKMGATAKTVGGSFLSLRAGIASFVAAAGIGKMASISAEFEDLRTALAAVTGGTKEAEDAFNFIQTTAAQMPLSVQQITKSFIQLKATGIEPTTKLLMTFSDAASVTTDRVQAFDAMTRVLSRGLQGGLGLEELNQLADRGLPIWDILQQKLGKTRLELGDVGKTAAGARKVIDALIEGIQERFGGATKSSLNNLSTKFSNFGDAVNRSADQIFRDSGLMQSMKDIIDDLTAALPYLSVVVTQVFKLMNDNIALAIKGWSALGKGLMEFLSGNWDEGVRGLNTFFDSFAAAGNNTLGILDRIKRGFDDIKKAGGSGIKKGPTLVMTKPATDAVETEFAKKTRTGLTEEIELLKVRTQMYGQSASAINLAIEATKLDQAIRKDGLVISEEELVALGRQAAEREKLTNLSKKQDFMKSTTDALSEEIELLKVRNATLGQSEASINAAIEATQLTHELKREGIELSSEEQTKLVEMIAQREKLSGIEEESKAIIEATLTPLEEYNKKLERLNELKAAGGLTTDQFNRGVEQTRNELIQSDPVLSKMSDGVTSFSDAMIDGFAAGQSAGDTFKGWFRSFAQDIIKQLTSMILKKLLFNAIFGAIESIGGGGGGTTAVPTATIWTANGGVMNSGRLTAFANGGVVGSPTLFPMKNGTGLMGEAGPEAIMPLTRGKNGKLGVQAGGAGGGTVINIDARGSNGDKAVEEAVERGIRRAAPQLVGAAVNRVKDERQRDPGFFGSGALA